MYLLQYLGKPGAAAQPYAVRAYNWKTKTLYPGAIVDRREPDEKMTGLPMTRTGTASGWAYTLYSRADKRPFVHALDTVHRRAFCVDLPWKDSDSWVGACACAFAAACSSCDAAAARSPGSTGRRSR